MPRPRPNGNNNLPGTPPIWLPLGGKLSPQVTDEGQICGNRPFPQLGGVTPPYFAIFPPASLSDKCARAARTPYLLFIIYYLNCPSPAKPHLPHNSPGTLPRANKAPPGLCCRSVRKATDTPCSRPRWCTDPQHPGKLQQKNSPTSPVNLYLPFISPGTLPRANKAPPGLCCRSVRKATDTPCSRPRWCTCPQYLGKSQ